MSVVGLTLAFCIAIGTGAGMWLDRRFDAEPAFTVVGFLLGAIAGFRELLRAIQKG
ncbi:MAG: AtpZ/AtpI family protein [Armatimonadetes bacterium]|nr:AtpZ/AtpI family protein [Armatimonadota bacterium]